MSETPPFSPTVALLTVATRWQAAFAEVLKPFGLTSRTYALLGHLHARPGISFSELARRSRISTPSAHQAVAGLKRDGLVADATERAGAASRLEVTPVGERALTLAGAAVARLDERFAAEFPGLTAALEEHVQETVRHRA
jgi:DNA-binding MarR family transcriptional regulator